LIVFKNYCYSYIFVFFIFQMCRPALVDVQGGRRLVEDAVGQSSPSEG